MKDFELTENEKKDFINGRKKLFVAIDNVIDLIESNVISIEGVEKNEILDIIDSIFIDLKINDFEEVSIYTPPNFDKKEDVLYITYLNWISKELNCVKFKDFIKRVMDINSKEEILDTVLKAIQNELKIIDIPDKVKKGNEMTNRYYIDIETARKNFEEVLKETFEKTFVNEKSDINMSILFNFFLNDVDGHYVSFSQEDPGKISYASKPEDKKNSDKRIKTTLGKYIKKYYKDYYNVNPTLYNNFEKNFNECFKNKIKDYLIEKKKTVMNEIKNTETSNTDSSKDINLLKIFKNRDLLLNGMDEILNINNLDFTEEEVLLLVDIISYIKEDKNKHYLTISQDDPNMVSYAKDPIDKFNNNKRVKLSFKRYVEKYILPQIITDGSLEDENFLEDVEMLLEDFENYMKSETIETNEKSKDFGEKDLEYLREELNKILKTKTVSQKSNNGFDNKYDYFNQNLKKEINDNEKADNKPLIKDIIIEQKKPNASKIEIKFEDDKVFVNDKEFIDKMEETSKRIKEEYNLKRDRDFILQAIDKILQRKDLGVFSYSLYKEINKFIEYDVNRHYLSLSQEDRGKVSYSKTEDNRYNNEKRTKGDFYKYIKKYIKQNIDKNGMKYADSYLKIAADNIMKTALKLKEQPIADEKFKEVINKFKENSAKMKENIKQQEFPNIFEKIQDEVKYKTVSEKDGDLTIVKSFKISSDGKEQKILTKKIYENNIPILDITYNYKGNIKSEIIFKNGQVYKKTDFFDNSVVKSVFYYKYRKLHNPTGVIPTQAITYFTEKGIVKESYAYNEGTKINKKCYYDNGKLKSITNYDVFGEIVSVINYNIDGKINVNTINNDKNITNKNEIFINNDKNITNKDEIFINKDVVNKKENKLKKEAYSAGYRIAANQISKGVRRSIITLMKETGMSDTKLKHVEDVLDSEVGLAIISAMMGYSLTYSKYQDERIKNIAKEFRTEGMVTAGNAIIDEAIKYIIPAIKESMKEVPDSKFRIEEAKEIEKQEENSYINKLEKQQVA